MKESHVSSTSSLVISNNRSYGSQNNFEHFFSLESIVALPKAFNNPRSMKILLWSSLTPFLAKGILFPTLFIKISHVGGTNLDLIPILVMFEMGKLIFSPLLGMWADFSGYKYPLFGCSVLVVCGSTLYLCAPSVNAVAVSAVLLGGGAAALTLSTHLWTCSRHNYSQVALASVLSWQRWLNLLSPVIGSLLAAVSSPSMEVHTPVIVLLGTALAAISGLSFIGGGNVLAMCGSDESAVPKFFSVAQDDRSKEEREEEEEEEAVGGFEGELQKDESFSILTLCLLAASTQVRGFEDMV